MTKQIIDVFYYSFFASEGEAEAQLIGTLVENLLGTTYELAIFVFAALHHGDIIGCAIFSRLIFSDDSRKVCFIPNGRSPTSSKKGHRIKSTAGKYRGYKDP